MEFFISNILMIAKTKGHLMKVKNLAIAISAALVISPLPALAKCITDGMGNISCKSSGFNDVFYV